MTEKRRSKRMDLNAILQLNEVETKKNVEGLNREPFYVQVLNVSRGGIAFKSSQELRLNTYYDIHVVLWTKAAFDSVIEVVRMESIEGDDVMYGCRFIGLKPSQELEIQIYETLQGIV